MSFPESQRIVFRENPLVEVICQLTFPSILAIAAEPPAQFQERIRERYPLYERSEGIPNLPPGMARMLTELPVPFPLDAVVHRFASEDQTSQVSLAPEFVAVAVTNYEEWGTFRAQLELAKSALEEVYNPAFYVRIGLRYRDVIDRARLGLSEVGWHELLNSALLSVLGTDEPIRHGVRIVRGEALVALDAPPGAFVKVAHGPVDQETKNTYAVDADWFTEERSNADGVFAILDLLNHQAGNLFRWAITPRLQDALGSRDD